MSEGIEMSSAVNKFPHNYNYDVVDVERMMKYVFKVDCKSIGIERESLPCYKIVQ